MKPSVLTVSSGSGPLEVREFVARLAGALAGILESRGVVVEQTLYVGPRDAPVSVDLVFLGQPEVVDELIGTHVLIARSERRGGRSRKRWFAGVSCVELTPVARPVLDVNEVRIERCRSGGAGGQHVNRTESAVRAVHLPTGLAVRVESERSQHQNRARALALLAERLAESQAEASAAHEKARRRRARAVERGRAVATWVQDGERLVRS